jgi:regulator of sigma E protease
LLAIACFICITSFLIVFHELGHYLSARMFGLKAKAFSVGLGPEIAGFTDHNGTRWKIAPIPLGGYVKFHGEMHPGTGTAEEADHPHSFARLARWKRAVVIFAGPFVNIVITAVILGALFTTYGVPRVSDVIQKVTEGSVAAQAGIRPGDRMVAWNGKTPDGSQNFVRYVKVNPGHEVDLRIQRGGETIDKTVTIARVPMEDRFGNRAEIGRIGVLFGQRMEKVQNPARLLDVAVTETRDLFTIQMSTIWQMIKGERSINEISGPVRLAKFSGEQFMAGWVPVIYFTAILSIAIAFMNLLPVPGLDGGYLALYGVETVMRRDLSRRTFSNAVKVGYGIVAALSIFGLTNDLRVLMF